MSNLGNLEFQIHLVDHTDADVAKIKSKLENLSLTLKIDGNNIKVSNTDIIKKQIEDAVKSVRINAVSIDAKSFSSQIESAAFMTTPKVKVEVLKDNLTTDIQALLDAKVFGIKISVTNQISEKDIKKIGTVSIPVKLTVDKKIALEGLKKSLLKMTVPIGVKMKDAKSLAADIRSRMKNMPVKVDIDANKNTLRSNINQALKGQKFTADLKLNIQTVDVQTAIRQAFAKAGLQYNTTASNVRANLINTRQQKADAYSDAQQALADLRRAQAASAQAALQQKNAMQGVNNVAERQKGVFAQLREQVANAYALYRVGRFLNTAMRIGGEFQQQHIALQTIIGDVDKANVLFERIKNLAVESPFKMLDLSKYTKQLAAFSIPYEELFDTLKRFGDLSAGLGVDMGRIILAYGQVRSAEFLKGTELRQFTEAGIPLVTELAKKYTDLRGELVSVGDVYDMISKKQVSFTDVKDVLWDMTSEGGKFFNMQSALTDTLKGKLDKLADSYEIFLSEIANSNNDVLGGTLDLLADTLKHWELIQDAVMTAVSAYGTYKATLLAVSAVQKASMAVEGIQKLITSYKFLHSATTSATIAQLAFNSASKANPYVMLAVGLATIASSMGLLFSNTNDTAEATAKLNAKLQEEQDNVEESRRNADKLVSVMANEKASMDKRTDAYNRLSNIYPSLFDNMTQEQAMLLKEAELRGMVADAAKKETKEKLEASLVDARANVGKAQKNVDYWEKFRTFKNKNGVIEETTNKSIKEDYDKAMSDLVSAQNLVTAIEESILLLDKKSAEQAQRVASRWFKEAQDYVNSLPKEYKGLMPKEDEDRETYFERIGKVVDELDGKIKELNEDSSAAQEVLGGYTTERDYANNIYTAILGGIDKAQQKALEEARKNRDKQNKENEKEQADAAKRLVQAYAESLKAEIAKIGNQWNLFKDLLEATGNENVSMNLAFGGQISFKSQLEQLEKMIEDEIKKNNLNVSVADLLNMSEGDIAAKINSGTWGEDIVKNLNSLTDAYKSESEKVKEESIRNFIEIVKNSNDFAQQIENIERKLQKDLNDLRANAAKGGLNKKDLERREAELTSRAEEEKSKVLFEEFKKSSDWVKVFDDLDRVSNATLDNMIKNVEEFARRTNLGVKETKELVEALGKLRDESIERNPLQGFKDAWNRKKYYQSLTGKIGEYDEHGKLITQQMIDDGVAEANEDLKDASLAVADKFQAVANAADLLSGLFENLGIDLGGISDLFGGMAGGAQAGAGIASAFGLAGPWGAIAGAAVGMLSSVFAMHDKALQKEIEASEARSELIENISKNLEETLERNLGGIYTTGIDKATRENLKNYIKDYELWKSVPTPFNKGVASKESYDKAYEALNQDSYYDAQLASLMLERDELKHRKELEADKKKADKAKLADYEQELIELESSIKNFALDMANSLYGIDFKDWSGQLAESLVSAWASGEDAVEAYKDTVNNILRDLGVSVISQKIIEPLLQSTMDDFLAQFEKDNGKLTESSMSILAGMADGAEEAAKVTEAYLEGLKKLGVDVSNTADEAKDGLSKGVQGVTEDTANLLGSYLNSIRQSVHVKQQLLEKLVSDDIPQMSYIAQAQLQELNQIAANTKRNADAADKIYDLVNRVVDKGSNKIKV